MNISVFLEVEFFLLLIFSFVLPVGIYVFLLNRTSISRATILFFALLLIGVSGIDVILLKFLQERAKVTSSIWDDKIFSTELSLALYLLPAVFTGIGINLCSHVLIGHLAEAEKQFDKDQLNKKA